MRNVIDMIEVIVNGKPVEVEENLLLSDLIARQQQQDVAVAVNQQFVPRGLYQQTQLKAGDQVELLVPMQGG